MSAGFFKRQLGRYDRRLWPLFFGRVITALGHGASFPFLAIYFTSRLEVDTFLVGVVISTGALMGGVSKFVGGALSDRLGRKIVMLVALAGRAGTTLGIGLLALQDRPDWIYIAGLYVIGGCFGRLFQPASQAMVADIADEMTRTAGYGLLRVGTNLGWAGGVMAGGLIGKASYAGMFLTTACVLAVSMIVILAFVRETAPARTRDPDEKAGKVGFRAALAVPGFFLLCAVGVLIHVVMSQLTMPLSIYGKDSLGLAEDRIGLLFFINGIMVVLLQFPVARWVETRYRLTTTLAVGSLLFAAGYGAAGFAHGFLPLALCVAVFTCGEIFVAPGTIALAANMAPEDRRGLLLGTFGLAGMVGDVTGPLLGGYNLGRFPATPWIHWGIIGATATAAAVGFLFLRLKVRPSADLG